MAVLEDEDKLVLNKLNRLGMTQLEAINRLHDLQVQGIHIRALNDPSSTKVVAKMAALVSGLITDLAELDRNLRGNAQERTLSTANVLVAILGDILRLRRPK